ncbi:MAG: hypothetical protein KDE53_38935, partial [Caldilineaceae bacterium]|nr:hypothetical protein [Caldilineaceae bacterium]
MSASSIAETTDDPLWVRQFGSAGHDSAQSIAVDSGSVYIGGDVTETLPGQVSAGARDAFVRKYDLAGSEQWTRQFGTPQDDSVSGVAVSTRGVYLAGYTAGALAGQSTAGGDDSFVRAYDTTGNELWTRQFGSDATDRAAQVASHDAALYVVGDTYGALPGQTNISQQGSSDAFVRKYDLAGNDLWTRQFAISDTTWGSAIAVDETGVYVTGSWRQRGGESHVFVRKYDLDGNLLWTSQFGSDAQDLPASIAVTEWGVAVVGNTFGTLPGQRSAGHVDAFVQGFDQAGNELWTRQFGTDTSDSATAVVADGPGIYVAGTTWGELLADRSYGASDLFVRGFDQAGNELWTRQWGSGAEDRTHAIAANESGLYLAGLTGNILPGQSSAGLSDAFAIKYDRRAPSWRNQLRNGGFEAGKVKWHFYSDSQGYFTTAMPGFGS